jgi:DNA invertase Pin-like site-specific DNA recombinase
LKKWWLVIESDLPLTQNGHRTKQGLKAAKAKGVKLGRPKGSKNKKGRVLDAHKEAIKKYLELGVNVSDISKIINDQLEKPITYNAFKYFIKHDEELAILAAKSPRK